MRRPALLTAALACLGCGPRRTSPPPRPSRCAVETVPGLRTRAVTWSRGRWVAAVPEGSALSLRAFDDRGEVQGEALSILDERVRPQDVSIVPAAEGVLVSAATDMGDLHLLSVRGDVVRESRVARVRADGDFTLVPRPDEPSQPAALVYATPRGVMLRIVDSDGSAGPPARCPATVSPRAMVAWRDGFYAVVTSGGLALITLDDRCAVGRRVSLSAAAVGAVPALAVDRDGVVVAWTDQRTWVAGVDHTGAPRIRPTALEADTAHAALALAPGGDQGRSEIRVIALRRNEIESRMLLYRLDPRGTLRDVGGLGAAPSMRATGAALDPWGGALIGWDRPEQSVTGAVARALPFFTRVCP